MVVERCGASFFRHLCLQKGRQQNSLRRIFGEKRKYSMALAQPCPPAPNACDAVVDNLVMFVMAIDSTVLAYTLKASSTIIIVITREVTDL